MHGVHGSPVLLSGETKEEHRNRFFFYINLFYCCF